MHTFMLYSPLSKWKRGEYPIAPLVHLAVGSSGQQDGYILLTAQLMTEKEVDDAVDGLLRELEEFRKSAKEELRAVLGKQLAK